jgi:hypothetical protein
MMTNEKSQPGSLPSRSGKFLGWPITSTGWWALRLTLGFVLFLALFFVLVSLGMRGGETFFSNPWLTITMLIAVSSAIAGGVFALIGIGWKKERSILVFISLLVGFFAAWFVIMTIAFPD